MALNNEQVEKIAHLARLEIQSADIAAYAQSLSDILQMVEKMNAIDTQGVMPMAHPLNASQRLREDRVTEIDQRTLLQQNAPAVENGLYLVPRVIE